MYITIIQFGKTIENKEDEINYLQSTKLTNEYVDVIDVVTTIEFILNNKSLIGEDIIIDGGHTYLLNNDLPPSTIKL